MPPKNTVQSTWLHPGLYPVEIIPGYSAEEVKANKGNKPEKPKLPADYQRPGLYEMITGKKLEDVPVIKAIKEKLKTADNALGNIPSSLMPQSGMEAMAAFSAPAMKLANPEVWKGIEGGVETLTKAHRGINGAKPVFVKTAQPVVKQTAVQLPKRERLAQQMYHKTYLELTPLERMHVNINR